MAYDDSETFECDNCGRVLPLISLLNEGSEYRVCDACLDAIAEKTEELYALASEVRHGIKLAQPRRVEAAHARICKLIDELRTTESAKYKKTFVPVSRIVLAPV